MRSAHWARCWIILVVTGVIVVAARAALVDPVKQALEAHKNAVCLVGTEVAGLEGPLADPHDRAWVAHLITYAATIGQELLTEPTSPLYTAPEKWLYWMPLDASGMNLTEVASAACVRACAALEAYCQLIEQDGDNPELLEEAAEALWQSQLLFCHLFEAAGIGS